MEGEEQGSGFRSRAGAAFYPLQSHGLMPHTQFRQGTKLLLKRKINKMERCRTQQVWAQRQEQPPHPKLLILPALPSSASHLTPDKCLMAKSCKELHRYQTIRLFKTFL